MEQPSLDVRIKINPLPSKLEPQRLDELLNGELVAFEKWFMDEQRRRGNRDPSPLIGVEKGIVRTYILYYATREQP